MFWLDGFALLVVGYNVFRGMGSGLIRSLASFLAIALASVLAWQNHAWGDVLVGMVPLHPVVAELARPFVVWVIAFLPINFMGIVLSRLISFTPLALLDKIGGAALGFLGGMIFVVLPLLLVSAFPLLQQLPPVQAALAHSLVAQALAPLCEGILAHP
ncbi:MAG: CvpA family protein [Bacteroidota bacterium]